MKSRSTDQITVHTRGGLGNQLFMLAAGIELSLQLGQEMVVDTYLHSLKGARPFRAAPLLQSSPIPISVKETYWPKWKLSLQNRDWFQFCDISERNFFTSKNGCMWGYFQSQAFHLKSRETIYASFTRSLANCLDAETRLTPSMDSITVHIRRGDYTTGSALKVHGCIDYDYYVRILQAECGVINVVSDDSNSMQMLKKKLPDREIRLVKGETEFQDLQFLSMSKRLVVSNSSFSWWGAALGIQNKIVHAPRSWYRNGKSATYPIQNLGWNLHETTFEEL